MKKNSKQQWRGFDGNLTAYGDEEFSRYLRGAFLQSAGYDAKDINRPVIGIADTSSDYTTCHREMPELVNAVKRGVLQAGGLPFVFPTISLGEILISPTSMLYRNLLAMETEEMIRAYPMDAVVLLGGCDKTVPAQLMAAISADVPAISVVAGSMRTGRINGERVGACTDCRRYWAKYRAESITNDELLKVQSSLCPTGGTCMVMGTASTMACITEAMGMMLPGGATPLAHSGERLKIAVASGREAVALAKKGLKPSDILNNKSFANAIAVLAAVGGSTNAIIHLTAIAGRAGIGLSPDDFNRIFSQVPLLVNCKPAGANYMEDFHNAGGMPVLLKTMKQYINNDTMTVTGKTIGQYLRKISVLRKRQEVIYTPESPFGSTGAIVSLKGTLAPYGAVIKKAAASVHLLHHCGPAVVFESPEDVIKRIDNPKLRITEDHVLVLRNAGPVAGGMPEAGSMPIPRYLAKKGVKDMIRISDARMSGTAFGTIILHCAPEAAVGGPIGLVKNGDMIELDVSKRRIDLRVSKRELQRRKKLIKPFKLPKRGWKRIHAQHVLQADLGADLDFLLKKGQSDKGTK
jgi:dihydroxy-acid dehydratase